MTDKLRMWVVYDHPTDFPDYYVVRLHEVTKEGSIPTPSIIMSPNLETIREMLLVEMGLSCIPWNEHDDSKILETWL